MTISAVQSFYIPAVAVTTIPGFTFTNLDSSGLRIEWSVFRDNTNKPDTGEVIVYNLGLATRSAIYEAWQAVRRGVQVNTFTLAIGWNKVPKIVMTGEIIELTPNRRTPTDVLTVWKIGDGAERVRDSIVGRDFHNVNIVVALENLVLFPPSPDDAGGGGLGLLFPPETKALVTQAAAEVTQLKGFQQWANITKGMSTKGAIDAIMETLGLEWRIHNSSFIAMRGGIINRPGPRISPSSGLIEYTTKDDGGITFTALADTRFEPGIRCAVLDNLGTPVGALSYRVESVRFTGTSDEDSLMEVVGRRPIGAVTPLVLIPDVGFAV
jgi:hypothetical protein